MARPRQARPNAAAAAAALDARPGPSRQALLTAATATAIALSLWASSAQGQEADPDGSTQPSGAAEASPDAATDPIVATVGEAEIRTSDLRQAIGQLPRPLVTQPPELVASTALRQLMLREAILQQARAEDLAQDSEVQSLVAAATQSAEEDALVQVWLRRELQARVPDQSVDQAYAALGAITTGELPPLDQLRPQIEENLRRQAIDEIEASLLTEADITFYGPDGQPRTGGAGAQGTGARGNEATADQAQGAEAGGQKGTAVEPPQDGSVPGTGGDQAEGGAVDPDQSQTGDATDQSDVGDQPTQDGN